MSDIKMEDIIEDEVSTSEAEQKETADEAATEQDPLKKELEKVQKKEPRTEAEKAAFTLKSTASRLRELGGDPASILGFKKEKEEADENDEDAPVTVGMLKKMQQKDAEKSALQMADEISNETERELVKYHLTNSIRSTGNPAEDMKLASAIVNSVKNTQIAEEIARKNPPKTHSSSSSAPARNEVEQELSSEEMLFTKAPFNMTKEAILKARK